MFIVFLKFSAHQSRAASLMDGHKRWIQRGFDDGVFLLVGSLEPDAGGCILASSTSRDDLEQRLRDDPFVAEDVVSIEIHEIDAARTDPRLSFLVG